MRKIQKRQERAKALMARDGGGRPRRGVDRHGARRDRAHIAKPQLDYISQPAPPPLLARWLRRGLELTCSPSPLRVR